VFFYYNAEIGYYGFSFDPVSAGLSTNANIADLLRSEK